MLVFSDIPSAGCRPSRYTECCCSKVIKGSSDLLYARSYSDPTDHNDSRSYTDLAFLENICSAMLPEIK
jgi:hypothetical protein